MHPQRRIEPGQPRLRDGLVGAEPVRHVNQGERSNPDCREEGEILLDGRTDADTVMPRASLSMLGDIPDENQVETAATATI